MAFRESIPFLVLFAVLSAGAYFIWPWLAILPGGLFLYTLYFFRDPHREISKDPSDIVSPADGVIVAVDEVEEQWFQKERRKRIAVFLSVFDVHVNRAPVTGKIEKIIYEPGAFLDARTPDVDLKNENQNWRIQSERGTVVVRQIAGLIARRIVGWKKEGESLEKGERFGLIRFGSRTDVYLPVECEIQVKKGDRVQGGSSVLARWSEVKE